MYKLVKVNVVNGEENTITKVPYRNNCAMIFVAGMLANLYSKGAVIAQAIWVEKRQLSEYQHKCSENSNHLRHTLTIHSQLIHTWDDH